MKIKTLPNKSQQLVVALTTNHKLFATDLKRMKVKLFSSRETSDMATGLPVGG